MVVHDADVARSQLGLLAMAEGFIPFRILTALRRLKVVDYLGDGAQSPVDLARAVGAPEDRLIRLLNAGVLIGVLVSENGTAYRVHPSWQPLLLPGAGDGYLGDWLDFLGTIDDALGDLDEAVLHGGPVRDAWNPAASDVRVSTRAMHNYAAMRGRELAHFLDTSGCRTLLDVGCGSGTYAFLLGRQNPGFALTLLDLPDVLEVAREIEATFDLANDVVYLPLDFLTEDIPGTYDLVLLSNTLHILDEDGCAAFIRRLYEHVNPGGSLVIQTPFLQDDRMGGRWPVVVDLNLLCLTAQGRNHSVAQARRWLADAGFQDIQHSRMSLLNVNEILRGYRV